MWFLSQIKELRAQQQRENETIQAIRQDLQVLKDLPKPEQLPPKYAERIAELEIKVGKMWAMIIEHDERRNKDKLNTFGKRIFGGMSKGMSNQGERRAS